MNGASKSGFFDSWHFTVTGHGSDLGGIPVKAFNAEYVKFTAFTSSV